MIKAVLFDLDNTLYNEFDLFEDALKAAHKVTKLGSFKKFKEEYKKAQKRIQSQPNYAFHNRMLYFLEMLDGKVDYKTILKAEEAYWNTFCSKIKPNKNVIKTLKELKKRKIKIGLLTNLTAKAQIKKVIKLGIGKYIDVLVPSQRAGKEKPNKEPFLYTVKKLKVKPSQAIMVGDSLTSDIAGANKVKMYSVWVPKKGETLSSKKSEQPKAIIEDISGVLKIIEEIN